MKSWSTRKQTLSVSSICSSPSEQIEETDNVDSSTCTESGTIDHNMQEATANLATEEDDSPPSPTESNSQNKCRKKQQRFSNEEQDVLLLKEILTVGPHRASFGRVTESWDLVARNLNSNYPEQFNNKISGIHRLLHLPVG